MRGLRSTTHDGTHATSEYGLHHPVTDCAHDTGEFHARYVNGPAEGSRIKTLSLHEIGGVDARRVHRHHDVEGTGHRRVALDQLEFFLFYC